MAKFGEIIRVLRIKRGYSQQRLAQQIGIGRSAIANYECGLREPDLDTVEMFADFFDVSVDDLVGREEEKQAEDKQQKPRKYRMLSAGALTLTDEQLDRVYAMAHLMYPDRFPLDDEERKEGQ